MLRREIAFSVCVLLGACKTSPATTAKPSSPAVERRVMLLAATSAPAFFLGSAPEAPAVGFGSSDAKLILLGSAQQGRVPVRVHGRLTLEAFVPEGMLELRAQRAETVEGTPVFVAPNDRVRLRGRAGPDGKVRVQVSAQVGELLLGPFEGHLPLASLAATEAPSDAPEAPTGILYALPANTPLALYREPKGELLALVPAQPEVQLVTVTSVTEGWLAVRVGTGPYLRGHTNAPLVLQGAAPSRVPSGSTASVEPPTLPRRIAETAGALKRVASGAEVLFRGKRIAVFRSEGWARVLQERDGMSEVFAAADELVSVRGLVKSERLSETEIEEGDGERTLGGGVEELGNPSP
jgi:hypothetical protein